ncbi:MAG: sensor histidine kinase [Rheinheimera sp.]
MLNPHEELDLLPCPLLVTDPQGAIIFANLQARQTFQLETTSSPTRIEQLFPAAGKIFLQTHVWPLLRKNGEVQQVYLKIARPEQPQLPVLLNAQSGVFAQQPCYRWVILAAQERAEFEQELIHTRQQMQHHAKTAEASRHMLQTLLDGAKDIAILAVSATGEIRFANQGAALLFGCSLDELSQQPMLTFFSAQTVPEHFSQLMKGETTLENQPALTLFYDGPFEATLQTKGDEEIEVQIQVRQLDASLVQDEMKFVLLITDIRQRKRYEKLQNDFIANISHELRTPLTSILGSLNLLDSGRLGTLPDKVQTLLHITTRNANRLKHLINDVLDFSKLKTADVSFHLSSFDLIPVLQEAISEHQYFLPEKKINLQLHYCSPSLQVYCDTQRLMQVISNLLSNAIKFTAAGTDVTITTTVKAQMAMVEVEDQGPGVQDAFLPYLFTQFSQQDSATNRQFEGTGLGLAICKTIIEKMAGQIGYYRKTTGHSVFWFSIPLDTTSSV